MLTLTMRMSPDLNPRATSLEAGPFSLVADDLFLFLLSSAPYDIPIHQTLKKSGSRGENRTDLELLWGNGPPREAGD